MDRTEFLQMCQKVSMLKNGICGIKENIPDELKIVYNENIYYPVAYELSFGKGKAIHTAILHNLNTNAILKTNLKGVEKYEQRRSGLVN